MKILCLYRFDCFHCVAHVFDVDTTMPSVTLLKTVLKHDILQCTLFEDEMFIRWTTETRRHFLSIHDISSDEETVVELTVLGDVGTLGIISVLSPSDNWTAGPRWTCDHLPSLDGPYKSSRCLYLSPSKSWTFATREPIVHRPPLEIQFCLPHLCNH
jgi:hypothetical protein